MDVSPKTLREVEFREKMRGYHPEDVDQFLERVAAGIEVLQDRLRQAVERAQRAEQAASEVGSADDAIKRTLVLAQRTADMAVQEAREQAARLLSGAEQQAQAVIAEAEARARQSQDGALTAARNELARLEKARDQAAGEVDALTSWVTVHRGRLTSALQEALSSVEKANFASPPPRPVDAGYSYSGPTITSSGSSGLPPAPGAVPGPPPSPQPQPPFASASPGQTPDLTGPAPMSEASGSRSAGSGAEGRNDAPGSMPTAQWTPPRPPGAAPSRTDPPELGADPVATSRPVAASGPDPGRGLPVDNGRSGAEPGRGPGAEVPRPGPARPSGWADGAARSDKNVDSASLSKDVTGEHSVAARDDGYDSAGQGRDDLYDQDFADARGFGARLRRRH